MKTFALAAAAVATFCLVGFSAGTPRTHSSANGSIDPVDAIIGTGTFNAVHPVKSGTREEQWAQMTRRLEYIESLLRSRDVSAWPAELRAEREHNLDRLYAYRLRGEYPINYDHPEAQKPCFIDRDGNICAVGYLVEQSAGRDLAEAINSRYQYATVAEMKSPELERWVAGSGLTLAEVRTIQEPGFNGEWQEEYVIEPPTSDTSNSVISYRSSSLEQSIQAGSSVRDTATVDRGASDLFDRAFNKASVGGKSDKPVHLK